MANSPLKKQSLEIRLNSVDDARAAVQNFVRIQKDAIEKGYDQITFVVERSQQRDILGIIGTFFRRVKTHYVWVEPPPTREFYPLPRYIPPPDANAEVQVTPDDSHSVPLSIPQTDDAVLNAAGIHPDDGGVGTSVSAQPVKNAGRFAPAKKSGSPA